MNCPSRNDDTSHHPGWNQNPNALSADLTTRQDLNGIANLRLQTHRTSSDILSLGNAEPHGGNFSLGPTGLEIPQSNQQVMQRGSCSGEAPADSVDEPRFPGKLDTSIRSITTTATKFSKFIGPGFMVAVAYMDPGNYATDVAAGAATQFQLLFVVLMSNLFAVVLQSLALRLGTVTGKNLAEHCRENLPRWLNWTLYVFAESAVVATDVAEVIGSAIAINLLIPAIPLLAGCALTLVDVLLILLFYAPDGGMRRMRPFEWFVVALVLAVVICFCLELSLIKGITVGEVLKGYVPSSTVVTGQGLYLSCGILGATVMPHSLYLGSGIVQPRLKHYDEKHPTTHSLRTTTLQDVTGYQPSLAAIKYCLKTSTFELILSLCVFAFFINSAILVVAGACLSGNEAAQNADLFGIFDLLSATIAPAAGILFAVALLFSGMSAGIVCTIAGQMISEGHVRWTFKPWLRRLVTRAIAIIPSIIIAGAVGRRGLSAALTGSQVVLSVVLPFVSAPLLYFTCLNRFMTVRVVDTSTGGSSEQPQDLHIKMRNSIFTSVLAILIWLVITIMNVALLVFLGLGEG